MVPADYQSFLETGDTSCWHAGTREGPGITEGCVVSQLLRILNLCPQLSGNFRLQVPEFPVLSSSIGH